MWGGGSPSDFQNLYLIVFLASVTAFISGIVLFFAIAVKAVTSSTGSASPTTTGSPAAFGAVSWRGDPRLFTDASVKREAMPSGLSAALTRLRIAIVAVIALALIDLLRRGGPSLSSRYGRYYLLSAVLTLLLSQLPFVVALIRIWRVSDGAGLGLAMVAGAVQVLAALPFFAYLQYNATLLDRWPWLHVFLSAAVVMFAYLAWHASGSRQEGVGLLISIFFGFLVYTVLARIVLAIISARERVP